MPADANAPRVITDAKSAASVEMSGRVRRYAVTMGIRMVCLVFCFVFHGWLRWAFFAGAVFLPYLAVLFANQANQKGGGPSRVVPGAPGDAHQITTGPSDGDVIVTGEVVEDENGGTWSPPDDGRQNRVA